MNNFRTAILTATEEIRVAEQKLVLSAQKSHNNYVDDSIAARKSCVLLRKYCNCLRRNAIKVQTTQYHHYTTLIQLIDKMLEYIQTMEYLIDHVEITLCEFSKTICFKIDGALEHANYATTLICVVENYFSEIARLEKNANELKTIANKVFELVE